MTPEKVFIVQRSEDMLPYDDWDEAIDTVFDVQAFDRDDADNLTVTTLATRATKQAAREAAEEIEETTLVSERGVREVDCGPAGDVTAD